MLWKHPRTARPFVPAVLDSPRELELWTSRECSGDKDTQHGTSGAVSHPSCSSFSGKTSKKCRGVTEAKTTGGGNNQHVAESCCEPWWVLPQWCQLGSLHSNQMPLRKPSCNLNPGSTLESSPGVSQFPCMGYPVPQTPRAEGPQPDREGACRSFALTWTLMQLHSGYTPESCSGRNYNATAVTWSQARLGLPSSPRLGQT